MTPIGQMTGEDMNPIMDMTEITPKVIWYNWSYFASAEELTEPENKHSENSDVISEHGQMDQIDRFCFSAICLF